MIELLYKKLEEADYKVCTDSRNITPGSLFFSLKGEHFDGNQYAQDALQKGALAVVIDNPAYHTDGCILVSNSLTALQELARTYRQKQHFKTLALTGSNGKTTTKELIRAVLEKKFKCHVTKGNLNNHIGVPLTILSAPKDTEILVTEMGANHIGEIEQLCQIALPDMGLITNIGKAHLEGFGGVEGVIRAKSELYQFLMQRKGTIFLHEADALLKSLIKDYANVVSYGNSESDCYLKQILAREGQSLVLSVHGEDYTLHTNLFGNYNAPNLLAALRIGLYFEIPVEDCLEALTLYKPENNRSQFIRTGKGNSLIVDCYNANPSSMQAALGSFQNHPSTHKILILGSMKELGESSEHEHLALLNQVRLIDTVECLLVGEEFSMLNLNKEKYFADTPGLINYIKKSQIENNLILIKGSRANQLERIIEFL